VSVRAKIAVEDRTMTAKQIEAAAVKLPRRERERIANRLLESLGPELEKQILDAWVAEAERRDRELDDGSEVALPYEEVMAELRASLRRK
jgi:putative addiction module component (TIGR02574 family)